MATHNTRNEAWEEELQNIMEDYLSHAEMRHYAKDPAAHLTEMREHWQVLKSFVANLLTTAAQEKEEAVKAEMERVKRLSAEYFEKGLGFVPGSINDSIFQELKSKYLTPPKNISSNETTV